MRIAKSQMAGIVLSAGASERMGSPKALLVLPNGKTLIESQVIAMREGGCDKIFVVVQPTSEVEAKTRGFISADFVKNERWTAGQFSSIVAGLSFAFGLADSNFVGALIMPVDAVGVSTETISAVIETAAINTHASAVVPEYAERKGHPIFVSREFGSRMIAMDANQSRMDVLLSTEKHVIRMPVNDKYSVNNVNTIEEWKEFLQNYGIKNDRNPNV